ncbi:CHAT domain-containing protein [Streptomyces pseudogriseolus]|uniref:CHAT domain-containing protein n=1 Tax=Streptomyces pseudogriseolus TaxID=36817 RepID=UPI003FA2EF29
MEEPDPRDEAAIDSVVVLVQDIHAGHLSEEAAEERVRSPQWEMTERQARLLVGLGRVQNRAGVSASGYLLARLVLAASDARWGRGISSPWWQAADLLVDSVRIDLANRPSASRLQLACDIADQQIATLQQEGRLEELAETMFAAGILRVDPHLGRPLLTHDGPSSHRARHIRYLQRQQVVTNSDCKECEGGDSEHLHDVLPHPADAALEALPYLYGAVGLSHGHLKGRCLAALNRALSVLMFEPEPREWLADMMWANSRVAADLIDPARDPIAWTRMRRIVANHDDSTVPASLAQVLPLSLSELVEKHGVRVAWGTVHQALGLLRETGNRDLLRELVSAVHRELPTPPDREYLREVWESEIHVLPGDELSCPRLETVREDVTTVLASVANNPERRAATTVHMAAHACLRGDPQVAIKLIEEAGLYAEPRVKEIREAITHLHANALAQAATASQQDGERAEAIDQYGKSAWGYAVLGLRDLALYQLESMVDCATESSPSDAFNAVVNLRLVAPQMGTALFPDAAFALNTMVQRLLAAVITGDPSSDLLLALDVTAKGLDLSLALTRTGPRPPAEILAGLLQRISELEGRPKQPALSRLDAIHEDLEMLCYAGIHERAAGNTDDEQLSNLRRSFDHQFSRRLYGLGRAQDLTLVTVNDVTSSLPGDSVLISLFIGLESELTAGNPSDGRRCAALYVTTITDGAPHEHRVTRYESAAGGLIQMGQDSYAHALHPLAPDVAGIRSAVRTDPLHRPVDRDAERYLDIDDLFGGLSDTLLRLHARGKRHLCFWAHGPYHYLPFPLLHVRGRPLGDMWTVTTIPSLACITEDKGSHTGHGLISVGAALGGTAWGQQPEPVLDEHARAVASRGKGTLLVGADANPASLLAHAQGARYVHVAAHGALPQEAPWFQCLYLNPAQPGEDGRLFAHNILTADLRGVDLVTLSACESALGRFDVADNLRGLPAAFLMAGARAVVGCLWPVRTDAATYFFSELYDHLVTHNDTLGAFRHAQVITRERFPQYQDWGTFVYHGGWTRPDERMR